MLISVSKTLHLNYLQFWAPGSLLLYLSISHSFSNLFLLPVVDNPDCGPADQCRILVGTRKVQPGHWNDEHEGLHTLHRILWILHKTTGENQWTSLVQEQYRKIQDPRVKSSWWSCNLEVQRWLGHRSWVVEGYQNWFVLYERRWTVSNWSCILEVL